ncbi:hypothetical protein [uncultured Pseudokineococcus sp.]|uniref:hypothetical protein n=1 Tax=uncultured Pseudokineococcus sp. TaxID=1642928 RepID=UPI0026327787|nr:hypothetical protein [uncultured Pseudokineococcus sp.]
MEAGSPLVEGGVLGGRYRLVRPVGGGRDAEDGRPAGRRGARTWRCHDVVLDRPVDLLLVAGGAELVVDAARRAALVDDARVLRVLDVGEDAGWAYVVTAVVPGETLAALVHRRGPLPPALARTLVGEAAQALERARALGLHHRRLTPSSLLRAADGGVVVAGVEVHAAVVEDVSPGAAAAGHRSDDHRGEDPRGGGRAGDGRDGDVDPAVAARADAVGLVALLHAALTGRWPGPLRAEEPAGAGDALEDADAPPLPLAPRAEDGPVPPGDLVDGVPADLDVLCAVTLGPHEDGPRTPGELAEQLAPWVSPYGDGRPAGGAQRAGLGRLVAGGVPGARRPDEPAPGPRPDGVVPWAGGGDGGASEEEVQDVRTEEERTREVAAVREPAAALAGSGTVAPAVVAGGGATGAMTASAAAPGASALPGARSARPGRSGRPARPGAGSVGAGGAGLSGGDGAGGVPRGGDALAAEPPERPARAQTAVVLVLVLVAVVVAAWLALGVLRDLGGGGDAAPAPGATSSPAPSASAPAADGQQPSPEPAPAPAPPQVVGAQSIDPLGDGEEGDDSVGAALDGDPATAWTSSTYTTEELGNLKEGFGYALQLGEGSTVSGVALTTAGSGGTVEVRTAPGPDLDGSQVVATVDLTGGTTDVALPQPVQTPYLMLWFTRLPDVGDGFRVEMSSVQVR